MFENMPHRDQIKFITVIGYIMYGRVYGYIFLTGNIPARDIASQKNISVYPSIHDIPDDRDKFDLITMWHVLEHVHDLQETVAKIESLLADNGILVIAVPNIESHDAKLYRKDWVALDTPRHLYHFSPNYGKTISSFQYG